MQKVLKDSEKEFLDYKKIQGQGKTRRVRTLYLPDNICQATGINAGDQVEIWLEGDIIHLRKFDAGKDSAKKD